MKPSQLLTDWPLFEMVHMAQSWLIHMVVQEWSNYGHQTDDDTLYIFY